MDFALSERNVADDAHSRLHGNLDDGSRHTGADGASAPLGKRRARQHFQRRPELETTMSTSVTQPVAPSATEPVRRFSELRKGDVDYAGGKGANLGELTSAGLPIPPGFVIGAPAYAAFCQEAGLRTRLADLLDNVDVEDTAALSQAAEQARALFDEAAMPDWLEHAIREAYDELSGSDGAVPVAVRSSATAEDTAAASFAGMNETFLNIIDADAVIDAVRHCWRSLFGARTVYYRGSQPGRHGHRGCRSAPDPVHSGRSDVHRKPRDGGPQPVGH
jgi:hypothetical protein